MANPDPEISYPAVKEVRPDILMGTGRSDYPNQVNNVLCFPFIFRGALDCRATTINDEMKLAAAQALASLAKEPVGQDICDTFGVDKLEFGMDYIIPKPTDPRVLTRLAPAVVKAAMETGVARIQLDLDQYKADLEKRMDASKARGKMVVDSFNYDF